MPLRPTLLSFVVVALVATLGSCSDAKKATASAQKGAAPAEQAPPVKAMEPSAARLDPERDADYIADDPMIPGRVGVRRVFLRQPRVAWVRDPLVLPGGEELLVVGKVGGVVGLYKLPIDGSAPAKLVQPLPQRDRNAPESARNRGGWFMGTPRLFPDGKHVIFDASTPNPYQRFPNVLGIAPVEGGIIHAVEAKGVVYARTPDVHPDGKTVIFSACDEIRTGQLDGRGDQVLESTVLLKLERAPGAKASVCTVHRPRFSRDGKRVVFEVIGRHLADELLVKYKVPEPINDGDGLIEPWIMNADGTAVRRLVDDAAYAAIDGRLQSGGSKEPEFSPDGESVVFSHGWSTVLVSVDGKNARVIATSNVAGEGNTAVQFVESDPTFSPDGKRVITASNIQSSERMAPPGLSVIDLEAADPKRGAP